MITSVCSQHLSPLYSQLYIVDSLIDKATDFLTRKGDHWVKEKLSHEENFSKAKEGMWFFMPFISKNVSKLLDDEEFSVEEKELFKSSFFIEKFQNNVFNETCLGDEWLAECKRES